MLEQIALRVDQVAGPGTMVVIWLRIMGYNRLARVEGS